MCGWGSLLAQFRDKAVYHCFGALVFHPQPERVPKRLNFVSDCDPMFPVQAFFNAISDDRFVSTIANLLQGVGAGFDVVYCEFPGDLAPGDEPFEGVRFSLYEDEVVINQQTFMPYLNFACEAYIQEHPEERHTIEQLMQSAPTSNR